MGVVATIKGEGGSKSGELAQALAEGKKIVVCTIQTFPFALEEVRRLAATKGKTFAVIADEAHSSQTGQAAAQLGCDLTKGTIAARRVLRPSSGGLLKFCCTSRPPEIGGNPTHGSDARDRLL